MKEDFCGGVVGLISFFCVINQQRTEIKKKKGRFLLKKEGLVCWFFFAITNPIPTC